MSMIRIQLLLICTIVPSTCFSQKGTADSTFANSHNISSSTKIFSIDELNQILKTNHIVLLNFNANWCSPCMEMEPVLSEIGKQYTDHIKLISINVDANENLAKAFGVKAIPSLQLYRNDKLLWFRAGFSGKKRIVKQIDKSLNR